MLRRKDLRDRAHPYLTPTWDAVANADFYEIELAGMRYTTIKDTA